MLVQVVETPLEELLHLVAAITLVRTPFKRPPNAQADPQAPYLCMQRRRAHEKIQQRHHTLYVSCGTHADCGIASVELLRDLFQLQCPQISYERNLDYSLVDLLSLAEDVTEWQRNCHFCGSCG